MDLPQSNQDAWETKAQIDETLKALDVSQDQIVRWRREGLLPPVDQIQTPYHGSLVRFPTGTIRQIAAAARLFKVKNRVPYVGWQLWWEGHPVDEKHWRPRLEKSARLFDQGLGLIAKYLKRDEQHPNNRTLQERMANSGATNIVMSRIRGRQSGAALATTLGTILQVATGQFEQFSIADAAVEGENADRFRTIEALDLDASQTDSILGERLRLIPELPGVFAAISKMLANDNVSQILELPDHFIFRARNDVRNSLRIYLAQYEAMKWIYGPTAFGLRLGAWIGKKKPDPLVSLMIIGFARLRQTSSQFLASEEIAKLADQAESNAHMSLQIRELGNQHPEFGFLFTAKRMRLAFQDQSAMHSWLREVEAARART